MIHTWTHVDLYKPRIEILVYHEVVAHHLEKSLFACDAPFTCLDTPNDDIFHFILYNFPLLWSDIVTKGLHLPHAVFNYCSFMIFLDGVVGKMHKFVIDVV